MDTLLYSPSHLYPTFSSHSSVLTTEASASPLSVHKLFSIPFSMNMGRSSSSEPARAPKRKGTRSVSSLTPAQLARKRANDREAQRAIRARTKEHIERLELEVEDLKKERAQSADQRVQNLLRKNQALEEEIFRLRESMNFSNGPGHREAPPSLTHPQHSHNSYTSAPPYEETISAGSGITSPRASPFSSHDYSPMPSSEPYHQQHSTTASSSFSVPGMTHSHSHHGQHVSSSSVSSPCSSCANTDSEYITAGGPPFIPTSVPSSMQHHSAPTPHHMMSSGPMGEKMQQSGGVLVPSAPPPAPQQMNYAPPPHQSQSGQQQNAQWPVYPVYYPPQQLQSPVH